MLLFGLLAGVAALGLIVATLAACGTETPGTGWRRRRLLRRERAARAVRDLAASDDDRRR
jgi:hypothetical protein